MQENETISNQQPVNIPPKQPSSDSFPSAGELIQEKKPNKWLTVGLATLTLSALGVAGFFAYQNYQLKKQIERPTPISEVTPTKTLQPTPTNTTSIPSPTPSIDPIVNWKTYTDEKYGWSVKYPNGWQVGKDAPDIESAVTFFRISPTFGRETIDFVIWESNRPGFWSNFSSFLDYRKLDQAVENFTVGQGIKAKRIYLPKGQGGPFDIVAFERNNLIYEFRATAGEEGLRLYHQVLSTFEFTN